MIHQSRTQRALVITAFLGRACETWSPRVLGAFQSRGCERLRRGKRQWTAPLTLNDRVIMLRLRPLIMSCRGKGMIKGLRSKIQPRLSPAHPNELVRE
jgi:hypothetical protein